MKRMREYRKKRMNCLPHPPCLVSASSASDSNQHQIRLPVVTRTEMKGVAGWRRDQGKRKTTTRVWIPPSCRLVCPQQQQEERSEVAMTYGCI